MKRRADTIDSSSEACTTSPVKLLTVVTINRNNETGLRRTITSLRCLRDNPAIEFVFIDGASSDGSVEAALDFYQPSEIISEPDRGIYHAMNKGLHRATGEYVVWINSGDEFACDMTVIDYIRNSVSDVIAFDTLNINLDDPTRTYIHEASAQRLPHSTLMHPGTYFRRRLVEQLGGYEDGWKIVADRELMIKCLHAGATFEFVPIVAAHFYYGGISSTDLHYLETIKLNRKLNIISYAGFVGRYVKYMLVIRKRTT